MFKDRVTVTWSPRFLDPRRPPWPQIGTLLVKAGTDLRQLTLSRIEYPTLSYNAEPVRCSLVGPPCPSKAGETPNSKPTSPSLLQSSVRIPHIKLQGGIFVRSHTLYYSICTNVSRNWSAWGHRHVLAATSCEVMDKNKRSLARAIQDSDTQPPRLEATSQS